MGVMDAGADLVASLADISIPPPLDTICSADDLDNYMRTFGPVLEARQLLDYRSWDTLGSPGPIGAKCQDGCIPVSLPARMHLMGLSLYHMCVFGAGTALVRSRTRRTTLTFRCCRPF